VGILQLDGLPKYELGSSSELVYSAVQQATEEEGQYLQVALHRHALKVSKLELEEKNFHKSDDTFKCTRNRLATLKDSVFVAKMRGAVSKTG